MARRKRPVSFRTSEVSHVVGATYSQLVYWDKTGLVKPSVKPASGRGSRRLYSIEDIFELKDGKTVYFYEDYNTLVDTLKQGQTVLRIAVQDLIADVQARLTSGQ